MSDAEIEEIYVGEFTDPDGNRCWCDPPVETDYDHPSVDVGGHVVEWLDIDRREWVPFETIRLWRALSGPVNPNQ